MLKFADLSVDFKSYENSFDSLMKLFPGSYYPLLVMYLAHKDMLKLEVDYDENNPSTLVSVDGNSLHNFFGDDLMKNVIQRGPDFDENSDFETAYRKLYESIIKDRDIYVMLPFTQLLPMILAGKSVALVADVPEDDQILDLINTLGIKNSTPETSAALLFFSIMLMSKNRANNYDHTLSEEEIAHEKRFDHKLWIEDFEYAMNKIMSYSNNKEWIQPKELTRVILTQRSGGSIYNPFAGLASYAIQLQYECGYYDDFFPSGNIGDYYYGEELNDMVWAIGKLRLLAYEADSKNYNQGDSTQWRGGVANNILSTPPFGYQIINEEGKKEFADHFVIRRGLETLADDGLLACVVPMSFMSRKDTADIRKRIVDEGLLESIVYLPENIFDNTSIRTAIIFIRKSTHNYVKLINAIDAIHGKNGKVNVLDVDLVANLLYHSSYPQFFYYDSDGSMEEVLPETKFERLKEVVSNERLAKANYDFLPGRYFIGSTPSIEGFRLIKISDIVEGTPDNIGTTGKGKVIRPALLSKDSFTKLLADNIPEEDFEKQYRFVDRDALLFSPLASLRPTLFVNPDKECVYLKPDTVQAVYLKKDVIVPEYLIIELNKPYVQEQVRLLTKGDVIPRLSLEDFLSIQVYVPSLRSKALLLEKESVEQQKTLYFSKINAELAALKDKQHDEYVKMLRQRKHRIGQILGDLIPGFDTLDEFRIENGGILRNTDVLAPKTGETVEDYFNILRKIINRVDTLVKNLTNNEVWGKPTAINIEDFLNDIPNNHLAENFKIQFDFRHNNQEINDEVSTKQFQVSVNESDFSTVFENIINNASKYGFTDSERNDYRIRISTENDVINDNPAIRICISNNGSPIHPSVDRSRFFEWGYGTGDGIGTWQLKDIVEHYGGIVSLNEYPEDTAGFCTEYEIVLPLIIEE